MKAHGQLIGLALLGAGLVAVGLWKCSGPAPVPRDARIVAPVNAEPKSTTTLVLRVTDRGLLVGARVLLSARGTPLHLGSIDVYGERQGGAACEMAPNVIGSWDGLIVARGVVEVPVGVDSCVPSPGIPYGRYEVMAWRGIEYELWHGTVDLRANHGKVELAIPLERAWTPHGTLAADLHVHARASSDSMMPNPQRVIAQVAAGIQVIALSDHNSNGDLAEDIAAMGLGDIVASIPSNELSSDILHAGVYPVAIVKDRPGHGSPTTEAVNELTVDQFFTTARTLAGAGVIQLNHPRLRASALYDAASWDGVKWPPPFPLAFDAVEVIAGHTNFNVADDRRLDDSVRDFYTMVDHGFLVAPLGNSDTHDFNWILDGSARNYVLVDDPKTKPFDVDRFVKAIKKRRVVATNGPWLDVEVAAQKGGPTVGPGMSIHAAGSAWVDITVERAAFVKVEHIRIVIGGTTRPQLAKAIDVTPDQRTFRWAGRIDLPRRDTWIGVTVDGDTPLPAEVTGSYHPDHKRGVTPYAIASPILVDADGDRRWRRAGIDLSLD